MEQELDSHTINKYVDSLTRLSNITGKLDAVLLYLEKSQNEDKFISSSLDSILKDVLEINGDKQYKKMSLGSHEITLAPKTENITKPNLNEREGGLNIKKVQSIGKQIKQPLKLNVVTDNSVLEHTFKNSSNLGHIEYKNPVLQVTFKSNGRIYNYPSVPKYKVEKTIELDKLDMHPGVYFNQEIKNNYGYAEVSGCSELVG